MTNQSTESWLRDNGYKIKEIACVRPRGPTMKLSIGVLLILLPGLACGADSVEQRVLNLVRASMDLDIAQYRSLGIEREYIHPKSNDSGIEYPYPDFVRPLRETQGIFIISGTDQISAEKAVVGRSVNILGGKTDLYLVKVRYVVLAGYEVGSSSGKIDFYREPRTVEEYVIMAIDQEDNKTKYIDSLPQGVYIYTAKRFIADSKKITGGYRISNADSIVAELARKK